MLVKWPYTLTPTIIIGMLPIRNYLVTEMANIDSAATDTILCHLMVSIVELTIMVFQQNILIRPTYYCAF